MTRHRPYPSDLSDARWELIGPALTAWRAERRGKGPDTGRPPEHDLRRIMDALLYVDRTGIPWRYLPHELLGRWPPVVFLAVVFLADCFFAAADSPAKRTQYRPEASRSPCA
ncbi:transposase [Streptomyces monashensis]